MIRIIRRYGSWLTPSKAWTPHVASPPQATGGVVPYTGEVMVCVVCGKIERSDPTKNTNWRAIDVDGQRVYACPREFPPDTADPAAFEAAFLKVFNAAVARHRS